MKRRKLLAAAGGGVLAGCSTRGGELTAERTETRQYDLPTATLIDVENQNGSATTVAEPRPDVSVEAVISGTTNDAVNAVSVTRERTDERLSIGVDVDGVRAETKVALTVRHPSSQPIQSVASTSGDLAVDIGTLRTDATIETTNGDVDLALTSGIDAEVIADAGGTVAVDHPDVRDTDRSGETVSAALGDATRVVSAETTNGDISIGLLDL